MGEQSYTDYLQDPDSAKNRLIGEGIRYMSVDTPPDVFKDVVLTIIRHAESAVDTVFAKEGK